MIIWSQMICSSVLKKVVVVMMQSLLLNQLLTILPIEVVVFMLQLSLDLSKAFDTVNHCKLFSSLIKAGLPVSVVNVICNWYGKMYLSTMEWLHLCCFFML